jgi:hypothetical protein
MWTHPVFNGTPDLSLKLPAQLGGSGTEVGTPGNSVKAACSSGAKHRSKIAGIDRQLCVKD